MDALTNNNATVHTQTAYIPHSFLLLNAAHNDITQKAVRRYGIVYDISIVMCIEDGVSKKQGLLIRTSSRIDHWLEVRDTKSKMSKQYTIDYSAVCGAVADPAK